MISSGCANNLVEPLCLPDRPVLQNISIPEQLDLKDANVEAFTKVAFNDLELKSYIRTIEGITKVHNEQFEAQCASAL